MQFATNNVLRMKILSTGEVGIGIATPTVSLHINATDAVVLPNGTSAQQPVSPLAGMLRYNNSISGLEYYNTGWTTIAPAPWLTSGSDIYFNSGNVGIGSASPTSHLTVHRTDDASITLSTQGNSAADDVAINLQTLNDAAGGLSFGTVTTTKGWTIGARGNAWAPAAEQNMAFIAHFNGTGWVQPLNLLPAGNVGINTTTVSPNAMLAVKDGHIQIQQTATTPTAAAGANCGGCAIPTLTNATDVAGRVNVTPTGTSAIGAQAIVTFGKQYATIPIVTLTAANSTAGEAIRGHGVYVTPTINGFTISYTVAPPTAPIVSGLQNQFYYIVIETQ
jgi:hypothetical protein